jgi:flagellar hook assembly protein FlgD
VPAAVSCPAITPTGPFRPDGDDGAGNEVDQVTLSLESAATPAWWVAEVQDALGELVVQRWLVPAGPTDEWSWDARDAAGFVVPSGSYTITVRPDDGFGNRGTGCVVQTSVEHPFEEI